jgi:hypothetical protein
MHEGFGNSAAVAREIHGQFRQGTDKIVSPMFGRVAKVIWPVKTASQMAAIAKCDERTAARWLCGEHKPPYSIMRAVNDALYGDE